MARMRKYSLAFCLIWITNQRPELGIFSFEFCQSLKTPRKFNEHWIYAWTLYTNKIYS